MVNYSTSNGQLQLVGLSDYSTPDGAIMPKHIEQQRKENNALMAIK